MRFFVTASQINKNQNKNKNQIVITGDDAGHICNVLRLKPKEQIVICDGAGTDYTCVLEKVTKTQAICSVLSFSQNKNELPFAITLYQGLPKNPKTDIIIQKTVELGIHQIVFVETSRSVPKIKDAEKKLSRLQKIAKAAAMQSQRGIIPKISIANFDTAIENIKGLGLIAHEKENEFTLRHVFAQTVLLKEMAVFVGPEGGFSQDEIDKATAVNMVPFTLGPRILRTETAAIVATAIIAYEIDHRRII